MKKKRKKPEEVKIELELSKIRKIRVAEEKAGIISEQEAKKPIRKLVPKLDIEHLDIRKVEDDGYIELKVPDHECKPECHHEKHKHHHEHPDKLSKFYLYSAFSLAILNLVVQLFEKILPIAFFYVSLSLLLLWFCLNLVLFFYFLAKRYEKEYPMFALYYVLKFVFFAVILGQMDVDSSLGMAIMIFTSMFESIFAFVLIRVKIK